MARHREGWLGAELDRGALYWDFTPAHLAAIDELMASGALEDITGAPRDDIQAELDSMRSGPDIELELRRLKGEIGTGSAQAIEGGTPAADGAAQSAADGAAQSAAAAAEQPQAGEGA